MENKTKYTLSLILAIGLVVAACEDSTVTTLAGSGQRGFADGSGSEAQFNYPSDVAIDGEGNIIVADKQNHRIRRITPSGEVSTLAGSGTAGFNDGSGNMAQFNFPSGIAVDGEGNIVVADGNNHRIRRITPSGEVSTLAGGGTSSMFVSGFADGSGSEAQFNYPSGVAIDGEGNIIVAEGGQIEISHRPDGTSSGVSFRGGNNSIRRITPSGEVSTLAGSGTPFEYGFADGSGSEAQFSSPFGVILDGEGNIVVADRENHSIRRITASGEVSTVAGSGTAGFTDGSSSEAQFSYPSGVAVDGEGNIIIADWDNQRIRRITPSGEVSTVAGSGIAGFADGSGSAAQFYAPAGVAVDGEGNIIVADRANHRIRKILVD